MPGKAIFTNFSDTKNTDNARTEGKLFAPTFASFPSLKEFIRNVYIVVQLCLLIPVKFICRLFWRHSGSIVPASQIFRYGDYPFPRASPVDHRGWWSVCCYRVNAVSFPGLTCCRCLWQLKSCHNHHFGNELQRVCLFNQCYSQPTPEKRTRTNQKQRPDRGSLFDDIFALYRSST